MALATCGRSFGEPQPADAATRSGVMRGARGRVPGGWRIASSLRTTRSLTCSADRRLCLDVRPCFCADRPRVCIPHRFQRRSSWSQRSRREASTASYMHRFWRPELSCPLPSNKASATASKLTSDPVLAKDSRGARSADDRMSLVSASSVSSHSARHECTQERTHRHRDVQGPATAARCESSTAVGGVSTQSQSKHRRPTGRHTLVALPCNRLR
jgi:hypothetical protein